MPVAAGVANVNGTHLYYEDHTPDAAPQAPCAPAVLLLHGSTLDRRMWAAQLEALAQLRVIAYDARGFGRSAPPAEAAPYKHCEDAAALCEHLGLRRVVAVGHSIGGHHMLELALSRPDLVAAYVSVCTSGLAGVPFPPEVTAMFAALRTTATSEGVDAAKGIWARSSWIAPALEAPETAAAMHAMLSDYSGWHWTHSNPAGSLVPPASGRLDTLRMPTLVVTGARDLFYNETIAKILVARIPGAQHLALAGSHMVNMEEPGPVSRGIAGIAAIAA